MNKEKTTREAGPPIGNATFPIYPEVRINETIIKHHGKYTKQISFGTTLRKEFEGKFYYWDHYRAMIFRPKDYEIGKISFIADMYKEVYFTIVLGIVVPELQSMEGYIYRVDISTLNEEERIKNTYPHLFKP